jgi:hypothetical protein
VLAGGRAIYGVSEDRTLMDGPPEQVTSSLLFTLDVLPFSTQLRQKGLESRLFAQARQ